MKKLLKNFLTKLRIFFTHKLDSKIDKLTQLHATLLSKQHKELYKKIIDRGGGSRY